MSARLERISALSRLLRTDCSSKLKEGPIKAPALPLDDFGYVTSLFVSQRIRAGED